MLKGFSSSAPRTTLADVQAEIGLLSEAERQLVLNDIYGKSPGFDETEELVVLALAALEHCIEATPQTARTSFDRARVECPLYVNDRSFRLMFLRREFFVAEKAAACLVAYWEAKVRVWGEDHAFHRLVLDDFTEEDQCALELGGIRCLPGRDKAGRAIVVIDRTRFDQRQSHRQSMIKLNWYTHEVALEDTDVQKNGIIYIAGSPRRISTLQDQDRKLDSIVLQHVRNALPARVVGVHHYVTSRMLEFIVPIILNLLGSEIRARYKLYSGYMEEDTYLNGLSTYGIKLDVLPTDMGGTHDFDYAEWLQERRDAGL